MDAESPPWLLRELVALTSAIETDTSREIVLSVSPRVQVLRSCSTERSGRALLVSDKSHACWAFLSDTCVACFERDHAGITFGKINGGLVYLDDYHFGFRKYPNENTHSVALIVEKIRYIGSSGCNAFGDSIRIGNDPVTRAVIGPASNFAGWAAELETRMLLRQASARKAAAEFSGSSLGAGTGVQWEHVNFSDKRALLLQDCQIPHKEQALLHQAMPKITVDRSAMLSNTAQQTNERRSEQADEEQQEEETLDLHLSPSSPISSQSASQSPGPQLSSDDDDIESAKDTTKITAKKPQLMQNMGDDEQQKQRQKDRALQKLQETFGSVCDPQDAGDAFVLRYISALSTED